MIEIHAYHGWGFDGSFWDSFRVEIPNEILFKVADRGILVVHLNLNSLIQLKRRLSSLILLDYIGVQRKT